MTATLKLTALALLRITISPYCLRLPPQSLDAYIIDIYIYYI